MRLEHFAVFTGVYTNEGVRSLDSVSCQTFSCSFAEFLMVFWCGPKSLEFGYGVLTLHFRLERGFLSGPYTRLGQGPCISSFDRWPPACSFQAFALLA